MQSGKAEYSWKISEFLDMHWAKDREHLGSVTYGVHIKPGREIRLSVHYASRADMGKVVQAAFSHFQAIRSWILPLTRARQFVDFPVQFLKKSMIQLDKYLLIAQTIVRRQEISEIGNVLLQPTAANVTAPDSDWVKSVMTQDGSRQATIIGSAATMDFVSGAIPKVVLPNVTVDGLYPCIVLDKPHFDFKVPVIPSDHRYVLFGWYQSKLPAVSLKIVDTKLHKTFVPFGPGTIDQNEGRFRQRFRARFAIPYAELRNPAQLIFQESSGSRVTMNTCCLPLSHTPFKSTIMTSSFSLISSRRSRSKRWSF